MVDNEVQNRHLCAAAVQRGTNRCLNQLLCLVTVEQYQVSHRQLSGNERHKMHRDAEQKDYFCFCWRVK